MNGRKKHYLLHSDRSSLVVDCSGIAPAIIYWGARVSDSSTAPMFAELATRQEAQARVENEVPVSLSPQSGAGFPGSPGIQLHRDGKQWGVYASIETVAEQDSEIAIRSRCEATDIAITHRISLDQRSNVLVATTEVENTGNEPLSLENCSSPTIPIPTHHTRILGFEGRWSNEFQMHAVDRFVGAYVRENRSGRTSHDTFPAVVLHTQHANESQGDSIALHLGWSGNHRIRVEELSDGRVYAQLGELLLPGEITLSPGGRYRSPPLYGVHGTSGFTQVSQDFHRYVRDKLTAGRVAGIPKPVHFNTWEAMYFDLSLDKLREQADAAADIGVERFVLDDGWFRNRRSDRSGLGDWFVDETIFPDGLGPLVRYVNDLNMEFGIWLEPEMVNPDSDLYGAHPDWVLSADPAPRELARNQLVLDLTRPDVRDYLFERIDALLSDHAITYIKWDMNRDLTQPGGHDGRCATHGQTLALYDLLARIREKHPDVEIESCSSGGGRADFGVLAHTDRVWTSDNNDPLDRLRIQKGFSFFLPAEIMGAHIGPRRCHISGREMSLAMRAGVALFGDLGIEANLAALPVEERAGLKAAVALHKKHRELIFSGNLVRLDMTPYENGFGIVSGDQQEALFSYALTDTTPGSAPGRYRFRGLDPAQLYSIEVVWPPHPSSYSTSILDVIDGATFSGEALMNAGMQLPILTPQSVLISHLQGQG